MPRLTLLTVCFSLTACAATDFWSAALMLALLLPACWAPPPIDGPTGGGAAAGGAGGGSGGTAGGGALEPCCLGNPDGGRIGVISTCYCPPSTACNFGWFTRCHDGCLPMIPAPDGGCP